MLNTDFSSAVLSTQKHSTGLIGQPVTKTCSKCRESLPLSHFHRSKGSKDGHHYYCKPCNVGNRAKWRDANIFKEKALAAKARAKRQGLEFNLTAEYLESIDRDTCPYLEIPIKFYKSGQGKKGFAIDGKSLDRITPELGYVEGNVIWCSQAANQLLSNYTAQDLLAIPLLWRVGVNFLRVLNSTKPTNDQTFY